MSYRLHFMYFIHISYIIELVKLIDCHLLLFLWHSVSLRTYRLLILEHPYDRSTGPEGWRIRQRHFETVTSLVRSCRRFFQPGSAFEIWSEFKWVPKILDLWYANMVEDSQWCSWYFINVSGILCCLFWVGMLNDNFATFSLFVTLSLAIWLVLHLVILTIYRVF